MGRTFPHLTGQQEGEQLYTRPVNGQLTYSYPQCVQHQQDQALRRKRCNEIPR